MIRNQDIVVREAHYDNGCEKSTRLGTRLQQHRNFESLKTNSAHANEFEPVCKILSNQSSSLRR